MTIRAVAPDHFPWFEYRNYTFSLGLQLGDNAWLSGHSASEFDPESKHIVVRGGMTEQTRTAYAKIETILAAAGKGVGDVHRVVEYVTAAGIEHYEEAVAVRTSVFGAHQPAICTVVVDRLLRPRALIEIEITAGPPGAPLVVGSPGTLASETSGTTVSSRTSSSRTSPSRASASHTSASRASASRAASSDAPRSRIASPPAAFDADGVVYLSTITAMNPDGSVEASGDLVGQTRVCFERALATLEATGLDGSSIVKTLDYTTRATLGDYKRTGRVRKELLPGPVYPGAAGILLSRLQHPDVLISLDVIASRHELEVVNPGWERYGKLTYSPAVKAGNLLFMSGQAALDPESERALFDGDIVAQAEYTYENIIRVLESAGLGPEHLIKTIEYVCPAGLERYRDVAKVRERLLRSPYPASTGAVCDALLRPEFLIEVDPLAYIP